MERNCAFLNPQLVASHITGCNSRITALTMACFVTVHAMSVTEDWKL